MLLPSGKMNVIFRSPYSSPIQKVELSWKEPVSVTVPAISFKAPQCRVKMSSFVNNVALDATKVNLQRKKYETL